MNTGVDVGYMAEHFPRQMAAHLSRALEISQERPDAIHHVYYDDLIKDPVGEIRRLYVALKEELTPMAERRMGVWLADNPQGKFGPHSYALSDWGLTREGLRPYFADYLKVHPVAA